MNYFEWARPKEANQSSCSTITVPLGASTSMHGESVPDVNSSCWSNFRVGGSDVGRVMDWARIRRPKGHGSGIFSVTWPEPVTRTSDRSLSRLIWISWRPGPRRASNEPSIPAAASQYNWSTILYSDWSLLTDGQVPSIHIHMAFPVEVFEMNISTPWRNMGHIRINRFCAYVTTHCLKLETGT